LKTLSIGFLFISLLSFTCASQFVIANEIKINNRNFFIKKTPAQAGAIKYF
jgi:hypothetical protein